MRPPKPIVQYWHSAELPELPAHVAELSRSFRRLNPDRPYLLFNRRSAESFIENHFGPEVSEAFRACAVPAMHSDYLRYCALWHSGGIWADAEFKCERNLAPLLDRAPGGGLFQWPSRISDRLLMSGLLFFPMPKHPFLRLAVDISTELVRRRWRGTASEVSGPMLLTIIYGLHRTGSTGALLGEVREAIQDSRLSYYLRYVETVCDLVEAHGGAADACEKVRIYPASSLSIWVSSPHGAPPHRNQKGHWSHAGSDIYVDAESPTAT